MRRLFAALGLLLCALPVLSATVWVTEYTGAPPVSVFYQAVRAPAITSQTASVTSSSVQSAVFNGNTGLVRVVCDVACLVEIGANPTATSTSLRMSAGVAEYFVVTPGHRLAVIEAPTP